MIQEFLLIFQLQTFGAKRGRKGDLVFPLFGSVVNGTTTSQQ
jgi:hypothetical protein